MTSADNSMFALALGDRQMSFYLPLSAKCRRLPWVASRCWVNSHLPVALLLIAALIWSPARAMADDLDLSGSTMGTTYSIKGHAASHIDREQLSAAIKRRLAEVDKQMSTYREDSEISQFNRAPSGEWFSVSAATARIVLEAQKISEITDGAFDITVGPAVQLWNFGSDRKTSFVLPSEADIQSTLGRIGYQKLQVRDSPPALKKEIDDLQIDLSAIAKGYGVDVISDVLVEHRIDNFMVEIGGEVRTLGERSEGQSWRIGIESPARDARSVGTIVPLKNQAMATSGDYRNFVEHDGRTYSHTIDPQTARPVTHELAAVTVISETCSQADALATSILVMGPELGFRWAEQHEVKALLLSRSGTGIVRQQTAQFPNSVPTLAPARGPRFGKTIMVSVVVFGIAILAMSVGVLLSNRRIQGSCGGLAGLRDEQGRTMCEACTKPSPDCAGEPELT